LLRDTAGGQAALLDVLATGAVVPQFTLRDELAAVRRLVHRYRDRPMSLADACLVRLAELYDEAAVMTVDRDFAVYRKHSRQAIPLLSPFA
jgi:predicted nucleic acid-binding protein